MQLGLYTKCLDPADNMNVARAHRILVLVTAPTESGEAQGQVTGDHVLGQMNLVGAQGILSLVSTPTEVSNEALDQVHTDHRGEMNDVSPSSNVAGKPDDECELATSDTQANAGRAKTLLEAFELEARSEGSEALPGAAAHTVLGKTTNGDTPSPQSVRSKPQSVRTPALVDVDNQGSTPVDFRSTEEVEGESGLGDGRHGGGRGAQDSVRRVDSVHGSWSWRSLQSPGEWIRHHPWWKKVAQAPGHHLALWACLVLYAGFIGLGAALSALLGTLGVFLGALLGMFRKMGEHFVMLLKIVSWAIRGLTKVYAELVKDGPTTIGVRFPVVEPTQPGSNAIAVGPGTIDQQDSDELRARNCSPIAISLLEAEDFARIAAEDPTSAHADLVGVGIRSRQDRTIIMNYSQQKARKATPNYKVQDSNTALVDGDLDCRNQLDFSSPSPSPPYLVSPTKREPLPA